MIQENLHTLSPNQMLDDVNQLANLYERVHPNPLAEFPVRSPVGELSQLKDRLSSPLSKLEFYKILAPILNGTGDEHTHLMLPSRELGTYAKQGGLFFPCDIVIVDGRAYVSVFLDGTEGGIPVGAELLTINSHPMSEILNTLKGFFSGTSDRQREFFLETSFPEAYYLGYGSEGEFKISFKVGENAMRETTLGGCPIGEVEHKTDFPILNESPLRFRNDNGFRRVRERAILLDFRAFENPRGRFDALLTQMFKIIQNEGRDLLIVDLRRNIGGSSFVAASLLSRLASGKYTLLESSELRASEELKRHFLSFIPPLLRALGVQYLHPWTSKLWRAKEGETVSVSFKPLHPRRHYEGKVIFLAGPGDYSSSAILLGAVKHYKLGMIVGEPSGGYPTHYGNCTRHALKNSQLEVLIPASINHGLGTGPVLPDHEVKAFPMDITTGRDVALEYAISLTA